jgi:replication factor C subunit 3/5
MICFVINKNSLFLLLYLRKYNNYNNNMNKNYLPWVEKYRPIYMNDIISHDQNIETIKKLLIGGSLPHLLFYGLPGTGKTSTIMALAREIYGNNIRLMVMKLDASDDRGINSVREEIKGFAEKSNMFHKGVRLIILDEADAMTFDAQFALRRIIEKYSSTIRFCLICNYENKIIPAIRSRCANFRFSNIKDEHIIIKLKNIIFKENIKCDDNIIKTISILSKGDLRKAINLLQCVTMQSNNELLSEQLCYDTAGIPSITDINYIVNILVDINMDFDKSYKLIINKIKNENYSLSIVLKEIINILLTNDYNNATKPIIISELSDLENMVSKSTFDDIYFTGLISIFKKYNFISSIV